MDDSPEASPISPITIDILTIVCGHLLQVFRNGEKGFWRDFSKILYLLVFIAFFVVPTAIPALLLVWSWPGVWLVGALCALIAWPIMLRPN